MSSDRYTFSVVICVLNNYEGLKDCVRSILAGSLLPDEINVVHSGDSELVREFVESMAADSRLAPIRFLCFKAARSLVLQRNIGIEKSSGDVVFFIDDDALVERDFFKVIMSYYSEHWSDGLGGVQGTLAGYDSISNFPENFFRKLLFLSHPNGKGRLQRSGYPSFLHYCPEPKRVEVFNGCQMSFKREILNKQKFDLFFEKNWFGDDYEFSYRISRNYSLIQLPDPIIHHLGSSQTNEGLKRIWEMQVPNHFYIFKKYFSGNPVNWGYYFVSFIGDMITVLSQALGHRSIAPLYGWLAGVRKLLENGAESTCTITLEKEGSERL